MPYLASQVAIIALLDTTTAIGEPILVGYRVELSDGTIGQRPIGIDTLGTILPDKELAEEALSEATTTSGDRSKGGRALHPLELHVGEV